MCTVSIIRPREELLRLVFSRDELHTRPDATAPALRDFGTNRAILPTDPAGNGTWLAASDAGMIFAILNRNLPNISAPANAISRGRIIPELLSADTPGDAVDRACDLNLSRFAPFRLLILGADQLVEVAWDTHVHEILQHDVHHPLMFTSSGLGDCQVEPPRRALFNSMLAARPTAAIQDAFHHHSWPGREHLSVWMSRRDARTVSITTLELSEHGIHLSYQPAIHGSLNDAQFISLPLQQMARIA